MSKFLAFFLVAAAVAAPPDIRLGYYQDKTVHYEVRDGVAIVEGDIVVGDPATLETPLPQANKNGREAVITPQQSMRWMDNTVYYTLDPSLADPSIVSAAIAEWQAKTPFTFVQRTTQPNYVRFFAGSGCYSSIGMIGGRQDISLASGCLTGAAIHEIGHAVGLFHEQSRQDRDAFVTVNVQNIQKTLAYNYDPALAEGDDVGPYDYTSIMHYSNYSFSNNGQEAMSTRPRGIPVGQRGELSVGDVQAAKRIAGQPDPMVWVTSNPPGLKITVDGTAVTTPQAFAWPVGSRHSLEAASSVQPSDDLRYQFARWSNDGAASQTVTVDNRNRFYMANYSRQYRVAARQLGNGTLTIDPPSADSFYTEGTVVRLVATSATGYKFFRWSANPNAYQGLSSNPYTVVVNSTTGQLVPTFSDAPLLYFTGQTTGGQRVSVDGTGFRLPVTFQFTPGSIHSIEATVTQTPIDSNISDYRDIFTGFSTGPAPSQTITAPPVDGFIQANFRRQWQLAYSALRGASRTTAAPGSLDGFYDDGTQVALSLTPISPYIFRSWTGDSTSTDTNLNVLMDQPRALSPNLLVPGFLSRSSVLNGADFAARSIAPGEILSIFGEQIGPSTPSGPQLVAGRFSTTLGGYQVLIGGTPASLLYASANQINCVVPFGVAGSSTATVQITGGAQPSNTQTLQVATAAPALFRFDAVALGGSANHVAALNQNGSANTPLNPAVRGEVVQLFATGMGGLTPAPPDGSTASALTVGAKLNAAVSVEIGGTPAQITYAGPAPGLVHGLTQINAVVPLGIAPGNAPIRVIADTFNGIENATIAVQ